MRRLGSRAARSAVVVPWSLAAARARSVVLVAGVAMLVVACGGGSSTGGTGGQSSGTGPSCMAQTLTYAVTGDCGPSGTLTFVRSPATKCYWEPMGTDTVGLPNQLVYDGCDPGGGCVWKLAGEVPPVGDADAGADAGLMGATCTATPPAGVTSSYTLDCIYCNFGAPRCTDMLTLM